MIFMSKVVTIQVEKPVVSYIDADRCTNCGTCRDYCPVGAISEKQKAICHSCPDCTEMRAIPLEKMIAMQNEACTLSCPVGLSPQGFLNLYRAGRKQEAFENIWDKNPLPAVTGYVCHHPCQSDCKRGSLVDRPLEIRAIQRYLGEEFIDYQPTPYPVTHDERIAVIGGGPAGLTAAHWLSKKGYKVTVFEQNGEAGGMLLRGIPEFRLNKDVVRKEIARLERAGITFVYNAKVGRDPSIDDLLEDYDRIVVASGTQLSKTLPIEGFRTQKVLLAVNFMEKVNARQNVSLSGNVVVIGGGSVAVDTARTALRLGADKVTIICLESGDCVPAHKWDLDAAREEGIEIIEGVSPTRFTGYTSLLEGVEYVKIKDLDLKKFTYDTVAGSETVVPADYAIIAIGQRSDIKWPENPNIVFAGDIVSGKCSVIDAMASGREAAIKIDNDLRGREYLEYKVSRTVEPGDLAYKIYPAVRRKLDFPDLPKLPPDERKASFDVVEKGLSDDGALLETYRCLQCGYNYVDPEKCIGCGVCQKVCPKGDVISLIAVPVIQNQEVR